MPLQGRDTCRMQCSLCPHHRHKGGVRQPHADGLARKVAGHVAPAWVGVCVSSTCYWWSVHGGPHWGVPPPLPHRRSWKHTSFYQQPVLATGMRHVPQPAATPGTLPLCAPPPPPPAAGPRPQAGAAGSSRAFSAPCVPETRSHNARRARKSFLQRWPRSRPRPPARGRRAAERNVRERRQLLTLGARPNSLCSGPEWPAPRRPPPLREAAAHAARRGPGPARPGPPNQTTVFVPCPAPAPPPVAAARGPPPARAAGATLAPCAPRTGGGHATPHALCARGGGGGGGGGECQGASHVNRTVAAPCPIRYTDAAFLQAWQAGCARSLCLPTPCTHCHTARHTSQFPSTPAM